MYKLVIKGQIVGITNDLEFLKSQKLIFGGEVKPYREIKKGKTYEKPQQPNNQIVFNITNN